MISKIKGELEIDHDRGVIYFHANKLAFIKEYGSVSIFRICNLPKPIPRKALDVTYLKGRVNWK